MILSKAALEGGSFAISEVNFLSKDSLTLGKKSAAISNGISTNCTPCSIDDCKKLTLYFVLPVKIATDVIAGVPDES